MELDLIRSLIAAHRETLRSSYFLYQFDGVSHVLLSPRAIISFIHDALHRVQSLSKAEIRWRVSIGCLENFHGEKRVIAIASRMSPSITKIKSSYSENI